MKCLRGFSLFLAIFTLSPLIILSQAAGSPADTGRFRLHKFEQPIGEENYTITRDGDTLTLKSDFEFTDRGTKVPLTATLRTAARLHAAELRHQGQHLAHVHHRH